MRNLLLILWKNHVLILFLLLETWAGYLVIRNNDFHNAGFINSANAAAASVLNTVNAVTGYFNLREENSRMAEEIARLRSMIPASSYDNHVSLYKVLDTLQGRQYIYIDAKVISSTVHRRNNYLTLNRGSLHGVKPEMGVVSGNGIVGIVKDVSDHFCSVMSVLHKNFHTSVGLKNSNYFGYLEWDAYDPRRGNVLNFPSHVKLAPGDTLFTTLASSIFPDKVPVGVIEKAEIQPGEKFQTVAVRFTADYYNLSYVYIVNNLMKEEQEQLEDRSRNDQ
jgi:rod shape-determining protein MreC